MADKKNVPINYYARDYQSIKDSLIEHTRRYYPDVYKDFSEASFGSLMLDTVSYIGDVLSFYLDYQVNESFINTATEYKNVIKLARQLGYVHEDIPTSYGLASFFITVPSTPNGLAPDTKFIPILKAGSEFGADNGANFILLEDVRFDKSTNETVVAANDENTNIPTFWAIKSYGVVLSGKYQTAQIEVGQFQRFLKLKVPLQNIAEITKVVDQEGTEYFEVENLSQDIVYVPISNRGANKKEVNSLLRPYSVPRRFVVEKSSANTFLQFGYGSDATVTNKQALVEPTEVILKKHGKNYVSDKSFDPVRLINTDKLGIVPANTVLSVVARINEAADVNIGVDKLVNVKKSIFEFEDERNLDRTLVNFIKASLEVTNEEKITGEAPRNNTEEVKIRALNSLSAQNRAVTLSDYKTLIYNMPAKYGSIKRVNVVRDQNSFKRNLNLYVISEDESKKLYTTNQIIKENVKVWLNNNRMINDTIDILDAKILNLGINYVIVNDLRYNKFEVINECSVALRNFYSYTREIGEPFFISDVSRVLKEVKGVLDIVSIDIVNKYGGSYSDLKYDLDQYRSPDGRYIEIPENVIFEIKFPDQDIRGAVA